MIGSAKINDRGEHTKHKDLLNSEDISRWYDNLKARSNLTAGVYLMGLGYYCDRMQTTPERILSDARGITQMQNQFMDFVRLMEREGKAGAYIARYKKVLHSWTRFNNVGDLTHQKLEHFSSLFIHNHLFFLFKSLLVSIPEYWIIQESLSKLSRC